jgi:hypothetical protein
LAAFGKFGSSEKPSLFDSKLEKRNKLQQGRPEKPIEGFSLFDGKVCQLFKQLKRFIDIHEHHEIKVSITSCYLHALGEDQRACAFEFLQDQQNRQ